MIAAPIAILQRAADLGLSLSFKPPDTLDVKASGPWPQSFADTLRAYKPQLLALLKLPFVMVYSRALEETLFFCEDEDTKAALISAGASEWSIYTKRELRVLVAQNRVAPLSQAELRKLHEIKQTFGARIAQNDCE
jgi:hypothetical protein